MTIKNKTITIETEETLQFFDITFQIEKFVEESGVENWMVNIQ